TKEDTINSVKAQATEGKEIFTNHVSGKGLISRIYLKIPVTQQQNKPNQKWAKNLNRHFSIKDMQAANKHIEGCSASLIIKQTQLKTTVRCHLTPTRVAAIRTENKCGEMTTLMLCWWKCKMVPLLWKTNIKPKKVNTELPYDPEMPFVGIYPTKLKTGSQANTCTPMFIAAPFTIGKMWKQPKCPRTDTWVNK
ncbi:LORF2 protein, partial [Crocuta crocuta]